ncbi:hypothetical protein M6B38_404375 [Iris pallida]|uniref:Uncharacterized protein n=1 Tax=Iris pallida TaxID=29817 RepID=A0AAX6FR79_IRIPA|nr:hypothetical protein M6B38_404375 [Iris pallida]
MSVAVREADITVEMIYNHAVLLSCNQTEASTLTRLVLCISVLHSCAMFSYRT